MADFTEDELKKKGFVPNGNGGWKKGENVKAIDNQPEKITEVPPYLWMPMNVPSSKNNKSLKWLFKGMKGKVSAYMQMKSGRRAVTPYIAESDRCVKYREQTKAYWIDRKKYFHRMIEGLEKPYIVEFMFVRPTRIRFDFHNAVQLPCDLMVDYGWIDDDDIKNILPIPPLPPKKTHIIDKKAGLFIRVIDPNKIVIVNN